MVTYCVLKYAGKARVGLRTGRHFYKGQVHPDIMLPCMKAEKIEKRISKSLRKIGHIHNKKVMKL